MKKMTGKISTKKRNYLSFMLVPHRKGGVRTIRISNYRTTLLSITAMMLVALLILTGYTLSVVKENQLLKERHNQELEFILAQKAELEDYIANQTNELIENAELISAASTTKTISEQAIEQYKKEYEEMVVAYVDNNMDTIRSVSRGKSNETTFKESIKELRALIELVESAKLSEDDTNSKINKKEHELTNFLNALPTYWPVDNSTTIHSDFGRRFHPIYKYYRSHDGIDIGNKKYPTIYAAGDGKVVEVGRTNGYGNYVAISHGNGFKTVYAHLSSYNVKVGEWVKKGQKIAKMGNTGTSTGTHLHFEIQINGVPTDPKKYLEKR
ncbi:MAG: peptidoglycan DD-metalloendopeptidase family protein [Acetivibrionales bacterium]|jgi:murein DD-endopeptidase MepM/ murein hydrolase activator NlpD